MKGRQWKGKAKAGGQLKTEGRRENGKKIWWRSGEKLPQQRAATASLSQFYVLNEGGRKQ